MSEMAFGYLTWDELVRAFWGKVPLAKEIPANILAGTTVGLRHRSHLRDLRLSRCHHRLSLGHSFLRRC